MKKTLRRIAATGLGLLVLWTAAPERAEAVVGAQPCTNPFSTVDWNVFFDNLQIGTYGRGDDSIPVCQCLTEGDLSAGIKMQIVELTGFLELTDQPFFFPCFQKESGNVVAQKKRGSMYGDSDEDYSDHYRNAHYITYPVFALLNLFLNQACLSLGTIDLPFLGEVIPEWYNDFIASMLHPEAGLFGNPVAQMGCLADCASSTMGRPLSSMPWCHGCWPVTKIGTGRERGHVPIIDEASMAMNVLDWMAMNYQAPQTIKVNERIPFVTTSPASINAIACGKRKYFPKLIKEAYFIGSSAPVSSGVWVLGDAPVKWAFFKTIPTFHDRVFQVWRKKSCCFGITQYITGEH